MSINPVNPSVLGANGLAGGVVSAIDDSIEANILVLGSDKNSLVLISCDLLYIGNPLRKMVERSLEDIVRPENIFMGATHTHRAPMTDFSKPSLGLADKENVEHIAQTISSAVRRIYSFEKRRVSAEVGYGEHQAGINRRKKRLISARRSSLNFNTVGMGPNARGPIDNTVRRVRFRDSEDRTIAEMWSTALHPTAYPARDRISADFPGQVRRGIREINGHQIPVIFFQGFSGDIRPKTRVTPFGLKRLLVGAEFAGFSREEYFAWARSLADAVLSVEFMTLGGNGQQSTRIPVTRELFVDGDVGPGEGFVHCIRLGELGLVGVPSEVVVEYSSTLRNEESHNQKNRHLWGIGCIDHVWGYSPTKEMLAEGGYEAGGFCVPFGVRNVSPNVESDLRWVLEKAKLILFPEVDI
ncbi:hypothetical protein N9I09_01010 [Pontimonas sp.]|nr:hypothetical protein [Pontimonas sp.]MDA8909482.1 hypothetical protein [Pontimonas sp.]